MPRGTRSLIDRIALVFDFDLTLAPGTIDAVLARFGIDYGVWSRDELEPLIQEGWDEIQAKAALLRRLSRVNGDLITRAFLQDVGRSLQPFPGAEAALRHLADLGREASGGAEVELYILSSGFTDIITATPIAPLFTEIWGSSFCYDDAARIDGVKRAVISIEKARYLTALAKGLGVGGANEPAGVDQDVPEEHWHVPLDQMLYVGDGASDVPAFDLLESHGGLAVGVLHRDDDGDWRTARHIHAAARVENLARADFRDGAPMRQILTHAVEILAKRVALRRVTANR